MFVNHIIGTKLSCFYVFCDSTTEDIALICVIINKETGEIVCFIYRLCKLLQAASFKVNC